MQIQKTNSSPNFSGKLAIQTYTMRGKASVETFATTRIQDRSIIRLAKTMTEGVKVDPIGEKASQAFAKLIEGITRKPLKKTSQQRMISFCDGAFISYGDKLPNKGGIFVNLDLK